MNSEITNSAFDKSKRILNSILNLGASSAEIFACYNKLKTVTFSSSKIFDIKTIIEKGFGIRYQKNSLMYFQAIDDTNFSKIEEHIASFTGEEANAYLQQPFEFSSPQFIDLDKFSRSNYDYELRDMKLEEIVSSIKKIQETVQTHKSALFIKSGVHTIKETHVLLTNTNEVELVYKNTLFQLAVQLVAGTKRSLTFEGNLGHIQHNKEFNYETFIEKRLNDLQPYLKGSDVKANQIYPIVFSSRAMCQLGDLIFRPLLSRMFEDKLLISKLRELSFSEHIILSEEANNPLRIGAHPFDHEGVPTKNLVLIQNGKIQNYPIDLQTSIETGKTPSGNTLRGLPLLNDFTIHRRPPQIALTNLTLNSNEELRGETLNNIKRGVKVDGIASINYFDIINGDFELSSTEAYHIKNDETIRPTNRITIFGNAFELLSMVEAIGKEVNDAYYTRFPEIRVSRMRVLGKPKRHH